MPWEKVELADVAGKILCGQCGKDIPKGHPLFYRDGMSLCSQCNSNKAQEKDQTRSTR